MGVRDDEGRGGVVLMLLLIGLLAVTVTAAVVGLWPIALVDLLVLLIVAVGLRAAFPARRAVLTYREIMEKQGRAVPVEPVFEGSEKQAVEQTEQPIPQPEVAVLAKPVMAAA